MTDIEFSTHAAIARDSLRSFAETIPHISDLSTVSQLFRVIDEVLEPLEEAATHLALWYDAHSGLEEGLALAENTGPYSALDATADLLEAADSIGMARAQLDVVRQEHANIEWPRLSQAIASPADRSLKSRVRERNHLDAARKRQPLVGVAESRRNGVCQGPAEARIGGSESPYLLS